ncbi:glycosyltransferase family 4 protein [Erythrobacter sp. GH1-10]|uniref:glycosyltransferase family 4 protein n=1 Tax=Erythrobacter sp. GH1-10 TaxID=3349334 RepID=UPI003878384D
MQASAASSRSKSGASVGAVPVSDRRLTVFYPMAGDTMGGSHVSLLGLLEGLDPANVRIIVGLEVPDGRLAEHYSAFEQVSDPAPPKTPFKAGEPFGIKSALSTLTGLRQRCAFLKENDIDIVHTNDGRTHATWALATKLANKKLLWHHRGNPNARGSRHVARWLADRIITVSSFAMPTQELVASGKARVVHSPFDVSISVDRELARKRICNEFGLAEDTIICGYFGTFIDRKRPLAFVDAVVELSKLTSRPVKGLLFGEATNEIEALSIAGKIAESKGLALDVGYRSPGHEWMSGCDLLLVPAIDEPLGRTLVEAMLVGTPVVATNSGGNPEALAGECGVLVPDLKAQTMAEAAIQLLNDDERRHSMLERAKRVSREKFSRERHVNEVLEVYRELIAR